MKIKETVLYYTPQVTPQTAKLKGVLVRLGIRIKNITPEQLQQTVGSLAGVSGYEERSSLPAPALPLIPEEMLVLHQFTNARLDELLQSLRKAGVRISLKAIVTESNCGWTLPELYEELKKEREAMTAQRRPIS